MTRGSELGSISRRRRLELGLSQSRIADAVGVSPLQVGRWERGEDIPDPSVVGVLVEVLDLGPETAEIWLASAEAQILSLEIGDDPLAPPLTVVEADPWSTPPERRIAPPVLDREAIIGKRNGRGMSLATTVVPITTGVPDASLERLLKRKVRSDERRLRREMIASHREERVRATAETRLRLAEEAMAAVAANRTPLPAPPETRQPTPVPAGAANTGVVFPVPDTKRGSERVTYRGVGEVPAGRYRFIYSFRLIGTIAALIVLAGLLWWAIGSLGDGLGAVMDLLRGGEESLQNPEAAGIIRSG